MSEMSYCLRSATLSDLEALVHLSELSFSKGLVGAYAPDLIEQSVPFISQVSQPLIQSGQLYVAEGDQGLLVGAGGWSRDYHGAPVVAGVGHIRQFVVHPDWTRHGIGRALFDFCLKAAKDVVQFDCQASLSAISFYRSLGFDVVAKDEVMLPNGIVFPSCLMRYRRPATA